MSLFGLSFVLHFVGIFAVGIIFVVSENVLKIVKCLCEIFLHEELVVFFKLFQSFVDRINELMIE